MKPTILSAVLSVVLLANVAGAACPDGSRTDGPAEVTAEALDGRNRPTPAGGGTCGIVGMESCFDHGGACGVVCIPIGCDFFNLSEGRLQLGTPPTLVLDLGTCGCSSASVSVSCMPTAYVGTAGVACTTNGATVTFSDELPDQSCCTLTFTGDIVAERTLTMLAGDVNGDGGVSSSDAADVKCCMGMSGTCGHPTRDVNRSCEISPSDYASVKQRLGRVAPSCPCP
jgi:hypothetical protein